MPLALFKATRGTVRVADEAREGTVMQDPADLVAAAAAGDEDAWEALVERYTGLLWAIARAHRLSTADAAEVVQITWLRLVENLERLRDPARVGAWLSTTARRECLRYLRQNTRQVPCPQIEPAYTDEAQLTPEVHVVEADRNRQLWAALEKLPDRCRMLLRVLMADSEPSYDEVSAALSIPIGSIGPTRARCLRRLRRSVEECGITAASYQARE